MTIGGKEKKMRESLKSVSEGFLYLLIFRADLCVSVWAVTGPGFCWSAHSSYCAPSSAFLHDIMRYSRSAQVSLTGCYGKSDMNKGPRVVSSGPANLCLKTQRRLLVILFRTPLRIFVLKKKVFIHSIIWCLFLFSKLTGLTKVSTMKDLIWLTHLLVSLFIWFVNFIFYISFQKQN